MINSIGLYNGNNVQNIQTQPVLTGGAQPAATNSISKPLIPFFTVKKENVSAINAPKT